MPQPRLRSVLATTLLICSTAAQSMPGFVSGQLLNTWCGKNQGLDREACYSYLRGASDAFHAIASASATENSPTSVTPWPNQCVPARVAIAALRDVYLEFAAKNPDQLGRQAASLLVEVFPQAFPCEKGKEALQ